jgi:plastocyanin
VKRALLAALGLALVAAPAAGHPGHTPTVSIAVYEYKPATITVVANDVVQWNWDGPDVNHSVTSDADSSEKFDSGDPEEQGARQGTQFTYFFTTPGTYRYHCRVHKSMHGTVVVRPGGAVDTVRPRLSHVRARVKGRKAVLKFKISERAQVKARARREGGAKTHSAYRFVSKGRAKVKVKLGRRGTYRVTLSAEDPTGNTSKTVAVTVRR